MRTNLHPFSAEAIAARSMFAGLSMEATGSADVIDPEVWGDMAQAEFDGAVRVLTSGAVVYDNTLEGQPGSTVEFGAWDALTDLVDLDEDDVLVPEKMGTSSHNVTIKEAGKAVAIKDRAKLVSLGDPEAEARRQFGVLAARKVDADLIEAAFADYGDNGGAPLQHVGEAGQPFGWDLVAESLEQFGDDFEPSEYAGLFIRAEQRTTIYKDELFVDATKLGGESVVRRGQIGDIAGLPVFVTNRLPLGQAGIIKRNALGALYKRRPIVESDRDILARETVVATNLHYAVKRMTRKGVLSLRMTPAAG